MNDLVVSKSTAKNIEDFIKSPSHAVLLVGATGAGKGSLAKSLASKILDLDNFDDYAYKLHITDQNGKIGIEQVRQVESFLNLKVPRNTNFNRAIVIENAQVLSQEAQNALLKTLEEPPMATLIVMTVNYAPALLPTVRSRMQTIDIVKPSQEDLQQHFSHANQAKVDQAYSISGGLPGLMTAMLEESEHPLKQATEQARELLKANTYQRLILIDALAKQRQLAIDTTFILQQMASISLRTAQGKAAKRWQSILEASFNTAEALNSSAQPKLALTALALAL